MYHSLFIFYFPAVEHLGCFQFGVIYKYNCYQHSCTQFSWNMCPVQDIFAYWFLYFLLENLLFILFLKKDFVYLFSQRGEWKEKEWERNIDIHHSVVSCVPLTGNLACNPGMRPAWESIQWPFSLHDDV